MLPVGFEPAVPSSKDRNGRHHSLISSLTNVLYNAVHAYYGYYVTGGMRGNNTMEWVVNNFHMSAEENFSSTITCTAR
jgi:hypothetical protein